jgi:hypothetical protein
MTETPPVLTVEPGAEDQFNDLPARYPDGVSLHLVEGHYKIGATIVLPPNSSIVGAGKDKTVLELLPHSDCHLFINEQRKGPKENYVFEGFRVEGNSERQERPADSKALTFCCAMYFKQAQHIQIRDVNFYDIRQTAMHFNNSDHIHASDCHCETLGWSGLSTSNGSNLFCDITVQNSGLDDRHSAIHLDGGVGVHCIAQVDQTTGNGIMLDSTFGHLTHVVVEGRASTSKRGVSLSGSGDNRLANVLIKGHFHDNREIGVMVSNADNVIVTDAVIENNAEVGLLMQGRNGGNGVVAYGCDIRDNGENVQERHASHSNWVFETASPVSGAQSHASKKTLKAFKSDPGRRR